jgi:Cd2+/Zn2+-exporting ATPase
MNCKLSISLNETTDITSKVQKIVASHEPSVKVKDMDEAKVTASEGHVQEHEHSGMDSEIKSYFFRLITAVTLTALFALIKVPDAVQLTAFILAYILVGFEVIKSAGKNILKGQFLMKIFLWVLLL